MYRRLAPAICLGLILLPLSGCSSGNDNPANRTPDGGRITDVPPIHLEQTLVTLAGGKPQRELAYRQALAACQRSTRPTIALSDAEVAKVGRTFKQAWFDGARTTASSDSWDASDAAQACHFELLHQSSQLLVDTGTISYTIDLLKHTGEQVPSDDGRGVVADDDDKLDPALAKLGMQRLGYATDAGQRCLRWRDSSDVESCVWSEGHRWGFLREEDADQATSYDPSRIVLWVRPADGDGPQLSTQRMSVGTPINPGVFVPPAGVSISKAD